MSVKFFDDDLPPPQKKQQFPTNPAKNPCKNPREVSPKKTTAEGILFPPTDAPEALCEKPMKNKNSHRENKEKPPKKNNRGLIHYKKQASAMLQKTSVRVCGCEAVTP